MSGHFEEIEFDTQQLDHRLKARLYVPDRITERTGLTTLLHGWGGNRTAFEPLAGLLDTADLMSINVEYRDSGFESRKGSESGQGWNMPYEFGKLQAIDVLRAVRAALERYPVNRRRLFLIGGSGGGHVALQAMGFAPRTFALTVPLAAISRPTSRRDVDGGLYPADPKPGVYADQGPEFDNGWGWEGTALGKAHYSADEWDIRNCQRPEHFAAVRGKVILIHGTTDETVDPRHAVDMASALLAAGKRVSLHLVDGVGHEGAHSNPSAAFPVGGFLEQFALRELESLETDGETDFDRRHTVQLGRWQISYASGLPVLNAPPS